MCEEESDDAEAVRKLLEINDSIHRTIERYRLVKKGDVDGAARIPKGTLGTTTGVSKNANNELSLIDFDPEPSPSAGGSQQATPTQRGNSLENDLLGLSMDDQVPSGGISLGPSKLSLMNGLVGESNKCQLFHRPTRSISHLRHRQCNKSQYLLSPTSTSCRR